MTRATDMERRPNVLFLMSDEHRADVSGYEGNSVIRTPILDELAATGVVFRNAYTPSPVCIPARQSLMAGQFPSTTGCRVFKEDLQPGAMTFARRFAQYAYETVACGKLHHTGTDQLQGWTRRIGGDVTVSSRHIVDRVEEEFSKYERPFESYKWSDAKEIMRAGIGRSFYAIDDEYTVEGALNFISEFFNSPYYDREQSQRPLLLKVSLVQPHYPYHTSAEKFEYYLNRVKPFVDQVVSTHPFLSQRQVVPAEDVSKREIQRAVAAYYGMVETLDQHFGRILDALRHVGQDLDDWIIVYTSDHGEMLGEHGIWEKQKFYEASARVPLIIRWPANIPTGRFVEANVNLCDLFATMCDLAGIPVPSGLDSRSLRPLMDGRAVDWDDETMSQFGQHNLMIKRGPLKYQSYGPHMPEVLFDLEQDPTETVDYADHPHYRDKMASFRTRRAELGYEPVVSVGSLC